MAGKNPALRSGRNYDTALVSRLTGFEAPAGETSRTLQSQKDEADINVLVKRFGLGGPFPVNVRAPKWGDFTGVGDFRSAMDAIRSAQASFYAMRPEVRARFDNDPARFVDFCSDPANVEEMRKMGLAVEVPSPEAKKVSELAEQEKAKKETA